MALALPWDYALGIAGACAVAGVGATVLAGGRESRRVQVVGAFLREAAVVIGLYALWQAVGGLSRGDAAGAFARAAWIDHTQATIGRRSEAAMQRLVLWSPALTQGANIYYAVVHFPATIALLIWLFARHRANYARARTVLALTTFLCLAIQLVPVAPPRLTPGVVDTAVLYGQSVYGGGVGADELSAMPSVHVAWALAVGWYVWRVAAGRWRMIGPFHAGMTLFVVIVTGNHWWLDGVAAALVLAVSGLAVAGASRAVAARSVLGSEQRHRRWRPAADTAWLPDDAGPLPSRESG